MRSGELRLERRKRVLAALMLGTVCAAALVFGGGTVSAKESLSERIASERRELKALQEELERIRKQRELVSSKERSVAERVKEAERAYGIARRALRLSEADVNRKDQELAAALRELEGRAQHREEIRRLARMRVRELAKWRGVYDGTVVVAASPSDMAMRYDMVRRVVERDRQTVLEAQHAAEAVSEQVAALERIRMDLAAVRNEERRAIQAVIAEREEKRRLLNEVRSERLAYSRSISDLEERSRRLEALIDDLVRVARRPRGGEGLEKFRGRLVWPVDGAVVGLFGRHRDERLGTYVDRKGIEIEVAGREAIRAVADGKVAYASTLKGYGKVVIVDHGGEYLSLYANAGDVKVKPGDAVGAGQPLASPGSDARLYFELRHGRDPLDPLGWLSTRGGTQ